MGTLYNQEPRQDKIESYVATVGYTLDYMYPNKTRREASAAEWTAAAEVTKAANAVQSADAWDEQLADLGELLQSVVETICSAINEWVAREDER